MSTNPTLQVLVAKGTITQAAADAMSAKYSFIQDASPVAAPVQVVDAVDTTNEINLDAPAPAVVEETIDDFVDGISDPAPSPEPPADTYQLFPASMKSEPIWLVYKMVWNAKTGKNDKIPYNPLTGFGGNRSALGVTFDVAVSKLEGFAGLGIYVEPPYIVIDIDHCRDPLTGVVEPWAMDIIHKLDTYAEASPSLTGVHIWLKGTKPGKACRKGIEIYSTDRFMTVTGIQIPNTPSTVNERDIVSVYSRMVAGEFESKDSKESTKPAGDRGIGGEFGTIRQTGTVITTKLELLMRGKIVSTTPFVIEDGLGNSLKYPTHSEADLALATALALKNPDPALIDEEFRKSPLLRDKWKDREKYRNDTIDAAIKTAGKIREEGKNVNPVVVLTEPPTESHPWVVPEPYIDTLLPVKPFRLDFLPVSIQPWVKDVSERMSVPLDFAGICAMEVLFGATCRRAFIYPKEFDKKWKEALAASGAIVANSGSTKTPTWKVFTTVLVDIDRDWQKEHAMKVAVYERDLENWEGDQREARTEAKKAGRVFVESGAPADPGPSRRLILNDATPEKAHSIMQENPAGVFVYRDEMSGWIAGLDQQGRESERGLTLAAMNGNDAYGLERIGRGTIFAVMSASFFGGFQPDVLIDFLSDTRNKSDGLIARFGLMSYPDSYDAPIVDRKSDEQAEGGFRRIVKNLAGMSAESVKLNFDPKAQTLWNAWLEANTRAIKQIYDPAIQSHRSKYKGLLAKLAGMIQLADIVAARDPAREELVDADHFDQALQFLDYLDSHMNRVYACVKTPEEKSLESMVGHILKGDLHQGFTVREIVRKRWHGLKDKDAVEQTLFTLYEMGWVVSTDKKGKTGQSTMRYYLNPSSSCRRGSCRVRSRHR